MSDYFYIFEKVKKEFKFVLHKKHEIFGVKEGYFLNDGFNVMIKREKDWITYRSSDFEKL